MGKVSLVIDGIRVEAGEGKSVLEAALDNGIYIPHLCYHPDLEPAGVCRLCLVEIEGRGLTIACKTPVEEGMLVRTHSPEIDLTRRVAVELLVANHYADCLSCPQNTECKLQEVAQFVGVDQKMLERLRMPERRYPLDESNPFFYRDPNKCVLCGICVRTCDEIQGVRAIDFAFRGFEVLVSTFAKRPLVETRCESCGECVERCPTGALMPKNYTRPTREVKTVCPYCGVGCLIHLGVKGEKIISVKADRENPVNEGSLCVKGRFGYEFIWSPERLKRPLVKRNGRFAEVSWEEALSLVAERFSKFKGPQFATISSSRCTNEENYLIQKLTRAVMRSDNVDNCARLCHAPTVAGLRQAFGAGGGTNAISEVEGASCIFVIGDNTTNAHPVLALRIKKAVRRGATLIVADPRRIELCDFAHLFLQLRPGSDVALLMGMAKVIYEQGLYDKQFIEERTEGFEEFVNALDNFDLEFVEEKTGVLKEDIVKAAVAYATKKPSLIVYSLGVTLHTHGTDNVLAIANLTLLTGNIGKPSAGAMPTRGQNNVQGACDMGCVPSVLPGYQPITDPEVRRKFEEAWGCEIPTEPGLTMVEFLQEALRGNVKALYIVGMDPVYSVSDTNRVREALERAEFVVFQDIFLTESAKLGDVILPAACFAEKEGTFTNLERRVQRVRKALEPPGEAKPDWWITSEIAKRMGAKGFDYSHPSEILEEIARLTPSYAGFSFERLDKEGGIQWPCYGPDHPGTQTLHTERFLTPSGKGRFSPLEYKPPAELPDEEFPLVLTTGRSLYHFHMAMTRRVEGLMALHPEEMVWINPADAEKLGIEDGDMVRVTSRRGSVAARAKVTDRTQPGVIFMTFHFYEVPTNILTAQHLDPVAKTPEFKVSTVRVEKA